MFLLVSSTDKSHAARIAKVHGSSADGGTVLVSRKKPLLKPDAVIHLPGVHASRNVVLLRRGIRLDGMSRKNLERSDLC